MISHNTLFVFFLGVATFTWLGCADGSDTGEKNTADTLAMKPQLSESQEELASIATAALEYRPLSEVIVCTGEVEVPPRGMASVTAPLGGYISRTSMVPGSVVRKGQRLATLTNPEYIVLQQNFFGDKRRIALCATGL